MSARNVEKIVLILKERTVIIKVTMFYNSKEKLRNILLKLLNINYTY